MKADIHPVEKPVIFRDERAGKDFILWSTMETKDTDTVDGQEMGVFRLDLSSASHPFYTGTQQVITTSDQVEKFKARMAKARKK